MRLSFTLCTFLVGMTLFPPKGISQKTTQTALDLSEGYVRKELVFKSNSLDFDLCGLEPGASYTVSAVGYGECVPTIFYEGENRGQKFIFEATEDCIPISVAPAADDCGSPTYLSVVRKGLNTGNGTASQMEMANLAAIPGGSAQSLIQDIFIGGGCFDIQNVQVIGAADGLGQFASGGASIGIESGVMIASGFVTNAPGPNNSESAGNDLFGGGDPDLNQIANGTVYDAVGIEFDFTPTIGTINFDFVFASEEYCEYVNAGYNDVFGFFISGPGISGPFSGGGINLATLPNGTPVTIDNVNHISNTAYFVPNNTSCGGTTNMADIQFDGYTTIITATANVIPCETYHIRLVVGDVGDGIYDSAVFLGANSFNAGGNANAEFFSATTGTNLVYESCNDGMITFTRSGDLSQPLTISWTIDPSSTATPGVDYTALPTSVTIPAGQSSVTLPLNVIADLLIEGVETIILNIDNTCSCSASMLEIQIDDPPPLEATLMDQEICGGLPVSLTPDVTAELPITGYEWNNGSTDPAIVDTPTETTTYVVTVTDACGATDTASSTVTVIPFAEATLSGSGTLCGGTGDTVHLTINFTGEPVWNFVYSINGIPQPPITTSENPYILVADQVGTYTLDELTSGIGGDCPGVPMGVATIFETELSPVANALPATCSQTNGSIDLTPAGGNAPYTYLWDNGSTDEDLFNVGPGTYTVTVTDDFGCTGTLSATVVEESNDPIPTAVPSPSMCSMENGSIDVSTTGGQSPYTYIWSTGSTDEDLFDVPPGTYTVTVTGADGCSTTLSVDLPNEDPPITITPVIFPNTVCPPAANNGSISVSVTPQIAPGGGVYVVTWSNGGSGFDQNDLPPGNYSVTVSAGGTCEEIGNFTVPDEPELPSLNVLPTASLCGLATGTVDLTVQGGGGPFVFQWDNGSTDEDLNGVLPGAYCVTVTGANGCTSEICADVPNDNPPISITPAILPNTNCAPLAGNGSISISVAPQTAPGGGLYDVVWSNGGSGFSQNDLPAGSYSVTVSGGGDCSQTATFEVADEPELPQISPIVTPSLCGLDNGSIDLSVNGGVPTFDIVWSNGGTGTPLVGITGGAYGVTVTGANGCSVTDNITVPDESFPIAIVSDIFPNTACPPFLPNGVISININPAAPPAPLTNYDVIWSNGGTGINQSDLPAGNYSVTVSAGASCSQTANFTVLEEPDLPALTPNAVSATCGQGNGGASVSVSGGIAPFVYQWSNGDNGPNITNVPAGTYSVTATGSNGCSAVASVEVPEETIPISIDSDIVPNTLCLVPGSGAGNGSISLTVNPPTAVVTWSNGGVGPIIENLPPGSYTVNVSAGGTCVETQSFIVPDESEVPNLSLQPSPTTCNAADGAVLLDVQGGAQPYFFLWSNGATTQNLMDILAGPYSVTVTTSTGCTAVANVNVPNNDILFSVSGQTTGNTACDFPNGMVQLSLEPPGNYTYLWSNGETTPYLLNVPAGSYSVTVSAGGTCTQSAVFNVFELAFPPNVSASATAATCGQANGAVNLNVEGNSPPFTFQWSNGSTSEDLENVPPGPYEVTVSDANGCTATTSANVNSNNIAINLTANAEPNLSCVSPDGQIDLSISPSGVYDIVWSNGETSEDLFNLPAGNYSVTVSAGGDCTSAASFLVENQTEDPQLTPTISPAICGEANGGIDLEILPVSGGPYAVVWSNGETTEDLTGLLPGDYGVTVTGINGCSASANFNVPNNSSNFTVSATTTPDDQCDEDNGTIDLTVTPSGAYSIVWSNGEMTEDLSNLPPGTYLVTVTEMGSCEATASFTVADETDFPSLSQNITAELCGQEDGAIDLTVSGTSTPFEFEWSNGETVEDLTNLTEGGYAVTVTGANGCSATSTANVPGNSVSFDLSGTPSANTSCDATNGAIDLVVNPPGIYDFAWSNGETSQSISGLAGGSYSVTVSAGGDCSAVANFTVPSTTADPVLAQAITPTICGEDNGGIDLDVTAGEAPFTFTWSNGETSEDLTNILSGAYAVTVTGSNGCQAIASYNVPDNPVQLTITGQSTPNTSCDISTGEIDINISPSGVYEFDWSNGEATEDLNGLPPGNYTVTVFEGTTCQAEATFIVENETNAPDLTPSVSPDVCGQSIGGIDLLPTGGTSPFTYLWSNGATSEDLTDVPAGSYAVTVTGADGCSNTGNYAVADLPVNIDLDGSVSPNTLCNAVNGGIDLTVAPAGSYVFEWSNGEVTEDLNALAPGDYSVTVTTGQTCSASQNFTVPNDAPTPELLGEATDILCFGENDGAIDLTISGGAGDYQIEWAPAISGNPEDPTDLAAGDYSVTVTDAAGCSESMDFFISQPTDAVQVSCGQSSGVTAPGASDGVAGVNISGGTAPYQVTWSPGGSQSGVMAGDFPITNLAEGQYDVTVVDANGCQTICDFLISGCQTAVGAMSGAVLDLCGEGCLTANYDAFGQNLEPDDTLEFVLHLGTSNAIVGEIARSYAPTFCFDPALMEYGVTYFISAVAGNDDGTGSVDLADDCTMVSVGTPIVFYEQPVADLNQPGPLTCDVTEVGLNGTSSLAGSIFEWSAVGGGIITGNPASPNVVATAAGNYTLIVTSPTSACADTVAVDVTDLSTNVEVAIVASPNEILDCAVSFITLDGTASGSTNLEYQWSDAGGVISTNMSINVNEGGIYQFIAFDPLSNCADTASVEITDNSDFPPLNLDPPPSLNCLETTGVLSGNSPIAGVEFQWATIEGGDTTILGSGPSLSVSEPGTYWFFGTADNGCENAISIEVEGDFTLPSANAGDDVSLDCFQNSIDLMGTSNTVDVTFNWSSDNPAIVISNPDVPTITVGEPGVYTLTVTALGNGCTAIDEVMVDLYENVPQGLLDLNEPDCFGDENGSITVLTAPANGPYEYSLDGISNGNLNTFYPLASGNYLIEVTDGHGCTWTTEVFLPQPNPLEVELGADLVVNLGDEVTLQALYTLPSSQLDTILWQPAEQLPCPEMPCDIQTISPTEQSIVSVTVVDTNGCLADDLVQLFVKKDRSVYIPNAFSPNGDGINDRFMVFASEEAVKVKKFLVYSRWGESVFEHYDFEPNNPAFGWDGTHRGEELDPAVFAYFAIVEFLDGQEVLFEGDVTLVR